MATYNLNRAAVAADNVLSLMTPYVLTGSSYPGRVVVGSEVCYVIGGAGTSEITVLRGADGTLRASHAHGAVVSDANIPTSGGVTPATPTLAQVLAAGNDANVLSITNINDLGGPGGVGQGGRVTPGDGTSNNAGDTNIEGANAKPGGGGHGGDVLIEAGNPDPDGGDRGGDVYLTPHAGDGAGRHGQVILTVPTSDPHVAGAVWSSSGTLHISAG